MENRFIRAEEVAQELSVSKPYAYKLIRQLNESATINWTDFLRAYTMNPYEERNFNHVRKKTT